MLLPVTDIVGLDSKRFANLTLAFNKKFMDQVRIDKYMWAIRLFKTRSLATKACNAGKVKIDGISIKPAHQVRVGTVFTVRVNHLLKTIEVVQLIEKRVGAKIAAECYKDLTPEEDVAKVKSAAFYSHEQRERGVGRPTKKERREIEDFKDDALDDWEEW